MSRLAAYFPILWLMMLVRPAPMSWLLATGDITEKMPPELGTFDVESGRTLKGVVANVGDKVY